MLQPLKYHLLGVQLILSSNVGQQNESPLVKFNLVCSMYSLSGILQLVIHFVGLCC